MHPWRSELHRTWQAPSNYFVWKYGPGIPDCQAHGMGRYGTLAPGCQRTRMEVEGPDTGLATLKAPLTGRRIESGDFDRLKNVEECEEHMAHIQPFVSFCAFLKVARLRRPRLCTSFSCSDRSLSDWKNPSKVTAGIKWNKKWNKMIRLGSPLSTEILVIHLDQGLSSFMMECWAPSREPNSWLLAFVSIFQDSWRFVDLWWIMIDMMNHRVGAVPKQAASQAWVVCWPSGKASRIFALQTLCQNTVGVTP